MSNLAEEIEKQRKLVKSDGYPVSIGELASMYKEGDLEIHPAFQRFFRWSASQKSGWIESLMLGIPTPSVFVAQREDGVWDVVDGLQRISTIFQFMGILKDQDGVLLENLELEGTDYLPSLEGISYDRGSRSFSEEQRRFLKREKLDVKIVLRDSDASSKYELFQRLNSGGSSLSDQELRNCMLVGIDQTFFDFIDGLSRNESFQECVPLPERMLRERFDVELVLRFIVFRNIPLEEYKSMRSLGQLLTVKMLDLVNDQSFDRSAEARAFKDVFEVLAIALGDDSFRKCDGDPSRFRGPFLVSAFEVIAMGLGHRNSYRDLSPERIREISVEEIWKSSDEVVSKSGESAVARLPRTLALGRKIFGKESSDGGE